MNSVFARNFWFPEFGNWVFGVESTMSSAKKLREARHRKILERAGDRLAYITGQVKELPPMEPSAALVSPPGESGLKSLFITGDLQSSSRLLHMQLQCSFCPLPLYPISDRFLPDKAIDLIDEASLRMRFRRMTTPPDLWEFDDRIADVHRKKESASNAQDFEKAASLRNREKTLLGEKV